MDWMSFGFYNTSQHENPQSNDKRERIDREK